MLPALLGTTVLAGTILAIGGSPASAHAAKLAPGCTVSPGAVALGESYTVSAWGLPADNNTNLIITYPNGSTLTGPIPVASGGSYSVTQSSASAIPTGQRGTYTYQFVGKVKWPQGTFTQSYASCSIVVS